MADYDFDEGRRERPAGFIIGGERFALADPGFKETAKWQDAPAPEPDEDGSGGGQEAADEQTVEFIEKFLHGDDLERWRKLLDRKADALTRGDLLGLARWLMEQHTERPTMRSSSSERGQTTTGRGSRAAVRLPGSSG